MLSEEEIIKGCLKGDKIAQKALYDKYSAKMYGICLRYLKNKDEAEDALQDGFVRVFNYIDKYKYKGSFDGWIRRIIVNTAINCLNQNIKHRYQSDFSEIEEVIEDTKAIIDTASVDHLLNVIQTLPPGYKIIFNMYEIDGYNHKEIAETLGISISTSKSQLMKAKMLLKTKIKL